MDLTSQILNYTYILAMYLKQALHRVTYTFNTGILFENGDSILEVLRWVFHYEMKLWAVIQSKYGFFISLYQIKIEIL